MMKKTGKDRVNEIVNWAESTEVPDITDILKLVKDVDLPLSFRKVLAVKLIPQSLTWTQKRKAEVAGVSVRHVYDVERDKRFIDAAKTFISEKMGNVLPEIWSAFINNALNGDSKNQALYLQQLGILDKPQKGGETIINNVINVEEKRKTNLETGLNRFGFTLDDNN